jgi:ABC-type phosphate transport system substrate-binding protein
MSAVTLLAVGSIVGVLVTRAASGGGGNVSCVPGSTTIAGSTAFAPTLTEIAQDYRSNCPQSTITVVPESSADALTALLYPSPKNPSAAPAAVMYDGSPSAATDVRSTAVAAISYAVVVNQNVPVAGLSSGQLRAIFAGQVTNWHDVGPTLPSMPIVAVEREPSSGTRQTFDKYVLDPILEAPTKVCPAPASANPPATICSATDTPTMLNIVRAVPGAIGYAELSASDAYPDLRRIQVDSHDPDLQPAIQRAVPPVYPFWTTEHLLTLQTPAPGSLLAAFFAYLNGDRAQNVMSKDGAFPCSGLSADRQARVCER